MFEPVYGSAPGIADPPSAIMSVPLLLADTGEALPLLGCTRLSANGLPRSGFQAWRAQADRHQSHRRQRKQSA